MISFDLFSETHFLVRTYISQRLLVAFCFKFDAWQRRPPYCCHIRHRLLQWHLHYWQYLLQFVWLYICNFCRFLIRLTLHWKVIFLSLKRGDLYFTVTQNFRARLSWGKIPVASLWTTKPRILPILEHCSRIMHPPFFSTFTIII